MAAEASYIPLTDAALDDFKEYIKHCVAYAEYRSGNTWTKIPIYKVETLPDGRVAIFVLFDPKRRIRLPGSAFTTRRAFCGQAAMRI